MNQQESIEHFLSALEVAKKMVLTGVEMAVITCLDLCPLTVGETANVLNVKLFRTRVKDEPTSNDLTQKALFFEYQPYEDKNITIVAYSKPVSELALLAVQFPN